jgi:hypothetical protein
VSHYLPESEKENEANCGRKESNKEGSAGRGPREKKRYRETLKRTIGTLGRKRERE